MNSSPILREKILILPNPRPSVPAESDVDGSTGTANAHRVVQLPINSTILISLLSYIFPVPQVLPSTVEQIMELLSVAQMYKMDAVLTYIRNHIALQRPPFIQKETAFFVYALTQKHGLRTEVFQAAQCTLSFSSMNIQKLAKDDKLGLMPGVFLHELWKYHQRVQSNIMSDMKEFKTTKLNRFKIQEEDEVCELPSRDNIPNWLDFYISYLGKGYAPAPLDFTDFHSKFSEHSKGMDQKYWREICLFCISIPEENICAFWETLVAAVEDSMTKVRSTHVVTSVDGPERGA